MRRSCVLEEEDLLVFLCFAVCLKLGGGGGGGFFDREQQRLFLENKHVLLFLLLGLRFLVLHLDCFVVVNASPTCLHRFPAAASWPVSGIFLLSFLYEHDVSFVFLLEERELHTIHTHTHTHIRNSGFFWKRIVEKLGVEEMSPIHVCLIPFFWLLLGRLLDKEKHGLDVAVLKHRRVDSSYAVDVKQLFRTTGKQASAWSVMAAIRSISSFVNPPTSLQRRSVIFHSNCCDSAVLQALWL